MATEYLNPTGTQSWEWSARDLCTWCGSKWAREGCYCRQCSSCTEYWKAPTRREYDEGRPPQEYCPDCVASVCVDCGLSACHDVHDPYTAGAGKHAFNDGVCTALVPYDPRFNFWTMVADSLERALIEELKAISASMRQTTVQTRQATRAIAAMMN